MSAPLAPPAPPAPPAPGGAPEEASGPRRETIVLITAIGGGLFALGLLLSAAMPAGGPFMATVTIAFAGAVTLFVGGLLGALSSRFPDGARVGFGIGAALALVLLLFVVSAGPAAATQSAPVCGVAVAAPGLFALRVFTMLRDVGL